jgi:ribosomal protein S18 acetylase RimI-like enzyme
VTVVRPLTLAACERAAALIRDHPLFATYPLSSDKLAADLAAALSREGEHVLAAEVRGELAGFVWFLERGTFYASGYVRLIVVAAGQTGGGVGAALMAEAERVVFAKSRDLFLLVNTDNLSAQRFYERLGYARVGLLEGYAAPGVDEFIYRKTRSRQEEDCT